MSLNKLIFIIKKIAWQSQIFQNKKCYKKLYVFRQFPYMILFGLIFCLYIALLLLFLYAIFKNAGFESQNNPIFLFFFDTIPHILLKPFKNIIKHREISQTSAQTLFGPGSRTRYLVVLIYYFVYHAFALIFIINVFPSFPFILENPEFHHMFAFVVLLLPWIIVLAFQFADPGIITTSNVDDYLRIYPYDKMMYHPAKCAYLLIPAVPRSRFCKFTNYRVAKYDHYCPWVLQPIGERNIRLYLLFLFANFTACTYLFAICAIYLIWKLKNSHIKFVNDSSFEKVLFGCLFALKKEPIVSGILILFFICMTAILPLIIREIYLISVNLTLSEITTIRAENQKIVNMYDKGIFQNWFEILFPEVI
ncbi:DHHC zinc finger domain containing protein [Tritrichomonas foetus]|uniref:Palmitoyltransferase n=1 Tax=Tritrichomonas foetus TaxID=1144522 RepID=A0A1J4KVM4_9EUKA|nr:DHHC zinc finger domain containing protein [Tritrichomonas foetus]|eukprot:OHT15361.1 DHHC zinc finger domain containing protein [Tritrichomonas foetus]